jgi:hypothetical protein
MDTPSPAPRFEPKTVRLTAEQLRLYQQIRGSLIPLPPDLIDWLNGHPHADLDDLWEDIARWVASSR